MQEKEEKSAPVVGESEKENVPESTIASSEEIKAAEAPKASSSETTKPEEQVVVCERCGTLRGAEAKVYQCQLCMMNFCVKHIDPYWHDCPSSRQS